MEARVLEALKESIKHWEDDIIFKFENDYTIKKNVDTQGSLSWHKYDCFDSWVLCSAADCALCRRFLSEDVKGCCIQCPLEVLVMVV